MNAPLFASPAHDELIGALVVACLVATGGLAPGRDRMASAGGLTFTTAVRMVDRVHGNAAVYRFFPEPAITSGFANRNVLMVYVADLAHGRHAVNQNFAGLAGRQFDQRVVAFFRDQLRRATGGAHHLRAFAWPEFQVVNGGTGRNVAQWQRIAYEDVSLRAAHDFLTDLQPDRLKDIALLAISIRGQRDARGAVGIILDGCHGARDTHFVALEIDSAELALVSATTVPNRNVACVAASARALLDLGQGLVRSIRRQLVIGQRSLEPQRRGHRSVSLDSHKNSASS